MEGLGIKITGETHVQAHPHAPRTSPCAKLCLHIVFGLANRVELVKDI